MAGFQNITFKSSDSRTSKTERAERFSRSGLFDKLGNPYRTFTFNNSYGESHNYELWGSGTMYNPYNIFLLDNNYPLSILKLDDLLEIIRALFEEIGYTASTAIYFKDSNLKLYYLTRVKSSNPAEQFVLYSVEDDSDLLIEM